nr:U3 small nucleolar ribonucleoprotein protein IMP4 [Tanacetum cinerariifolium]
MKDNVMWVWDNSTWGGRDKGFGTIQVGAGVRGSSLGEMGFLKGNVVTGLLGLGKSLEGKERQIYEKKRKIKLALQEGKPIPTELRNEEAALRQEIDLEDDNTAVPKPDTKRIITFANDADYISFRHHVYRQSGGPKSVELKE